MSDVDVLLSMGKNDPIVSMIESEHVINLFKHQGAGLQKYGSIVMKLHKLDYRKVKNTEFIMEKDSKMYGSHLWVHLSNLFREY